MNKRKHSLMAVFLIVALTTFSLTPALAQTDSLVFGIMPDQSPVSVIKNFAPLVDKLERSLGIQVELVTAPDLYSFLDRVYDGAYDLIYISNGGYLKASAHGTYHAIAKGTPATRGGVIVRRDSGILSIDQLKGRKIASAIPESFACHRFLKIKLQDAGIGETVSFAFLKTMDSIVYSVLNKKYDAGTVKVDILEKPNFANVLDQLRVIDTSLEIPRMPFAIRNGTDSKTEQAIIAALTSISKNDSVGKGILQQLNVESIVAASDADYAEFRGILEKRPGRRQEKP